MGAQHADIGFVHGHLLAVIVAVELGQERSLLYPLSFLDRQVNDATRHLEAHHALVRLDIAGKLQDIDGGGLVRPVGTQVEVVRARQRCGEHEEN